MMIEILIGAGVTILVLASALVVSLRQGAKASQRAELAEGMLNMIRTNNQDNDDFAKSQEHEINEENSRIDRRQYFDN